MTTPMHPGDRHYRNQVVRLADLTVTQDVIEDVTFEGCTLVGPAIVILLGGGTLQGSRFDGDPQGVLWPIGERQQIVGAIGLRDCNIVSCRFQRVGLAYADVQLPMLRAGGLIP